MQQVLSPGCKYIHPVAG